MSYGCYSKGGTIYSRSEDDASKVAEFLSDIGIDNELRTEPDTNVVEVYGSNCISYKEEDYEDIAKLAIKDSYISFIGEDDSVWTLKFEGGKVYDYTGEILWDHTADEMSKGATIIRKSDDKTVSISCDNDEAEFHFYGEESDKEQLLMAITKFLGFEPREMLNLNWKLLRCKGCEIFDAEANIPSCEVLERGIYGIEDADCPKNNRCANCIALAEGDTGEWLCDDFEDEIHHISSYTCSF